MRTRRNLPGLMVDFPTMVNSLLNDELLKPVTPTSTFRKPSVNIAEDKDSYGIELLAPGFEKEDFSIKVENNQLIIEAELKIEKEETTDNYKHREFHVASFKRMFSLPENEINDDAISANYVNGILKVVLPKKEEAKPKEPKTIAIH